MTHSLYLEISIDDQRLNVCDSSGVVRSFPISTGKKGVGFQEGSFRTPTGRFQISEKIGEGEERYTIFKQRQAVGTWEMGQGMDQDLVLTRIIRLEGLDPENANTMERFIYIHGTNREDLIGYPASMGCVRLANSDMEELFKMTSIKDSVTIQPPVNRKGNIMFFDCDSTLSSIEGIDELARARGPEIYKKVVALTNQAMNGEIALNEVFPRRMEIIQPDKKTCDQVAELYIKTVMPGAKALIKWLKKNNWLPVIVSGGFAPLIEPLAKYLGIDYVEAVPLYLDDRGNYAGYGTDYPTTRNLGKNEIIREWKKAILPLKTAMMGDGISDLETQSDVDWFIGYGGVVERPLVKTGARYWVTKLSDTRITELLLKGEINKKRSHDEIISNNKRKINLPASKSELGCAPMSTSAKKAQKGKRYTAEEKNEIVAFVQKYNDENGRGGQSTASKKFGISQLTISSWLKSDTSVVVKRGRKPGSGKASKGGSYSARINSLTSLAAQIDKAEAELEKLKAKFHSLKSEI